MPHYCLKEVKKLVQAESIEFDRNAEKTFDDLCDATGFGTKNLIEAIQSIKLDDFHKSISYTRFVADVYKTTYYFKTINEWDEPEVDPIDLYVKLAVREVQGIKKIVLLTSFKQL